MKKSFNDFIEILLDGKRFTILNGYKFDRLIFSLFVLGMLVSFMVIFSYYGKDKSDHVYYNCVKSSENSPACNNPFYQNHPFCEKVWVGACDQEFTPAGFIYGEPVPFVVKHWETFLSFALVFCFILNHFIHNINFFELEDGD